MPVRQVPRHEFWPSGDSQPLVMLRFEPNELATRYGLTFEEGNDNLDYFKLAAIELRDRSQAWLIRHRGNPVPGTIVYVDKASDPTKARVHVQDALGLQEADFTWIAPAARTPAVSA